MSCPSSNGCLVMPDSRDSTLDNYYHIWVSREMLVQAFSHSYELGMKGNFNHSEIIVHVYV